MKHHPVTVFAVLALLLAVAAGCGPTRSATAISAAKDGMYQARIAGAHEYKPGARYDTKAQYNYFLAVEYLEKAKVFQGFSEFDAAESFAIKAARLTKEAIELLEEHERHIGNKCVQPTRGGAK